MPLDALLVEHAPSSVFFGDLADVAMMPTVKVQIYTRDRLIRGILQGKDIRCLRDHVSMKETGHLGLRKRAREGQGLMCRGIHRGW